MRECCWPVCVMLLLLSGCDLAPRYTQPSIAAAPTTFKESGPWTPAQPDDGAYRGAWWKIIDDPQLDALEQRVMSDSPQLAAAVARYDEASALARRARSGLFPQLDAKASAARMRTASPSTGTHIDYRDYAIGASVSYELDLWGRVRNLVAAGDAEKQASAADLAVVKLSLQAELADHYVQLRGLDAQIVLLRQTGNAYDAALQLTMKRFAGGAASELDVGRARTQLASAQSDIEQRMADRALLEHAIAVLVGEQASVFSIAPEQVFAEPPPVPVTAPSRLLQRRPDVAAAERRVAAANSRIGVARAAFFPAITLGGSGGVEATAGTLFSAANRVWALGPAAALLPIFDGGSRSADLDQARAQLNEAAADYRQTTLDSFREVEDQLALINRLANASQREAEAVKAAQRTTQLANVQYREGAVDYLQVVTAQTAELQVRETQITLQARRLTACVDLVRALGGSWETDSGITIGANPSQPAIR
ncbi:efflux transporter outer membrane subunit [Paraburkholderia megapolitana]|uniref:Efflux transporter, outer membrane factor (OMF) lipoprotein, NodT family n=1 Tax=Paraburkholderia megapolitana TaxID=420953 RepID=A0A1I3EVW2_9BURK|nr:efflux transporter outer membrane subunit [Paraburkholderia megapolitana]QDQ80292.1 efflux transporter outer membrane subunit [Paraburkholderia megapolitana]SFI02691.1 efflux transporter, outer membrane factor (OMF) lipoprotein, NodT family [Paraburkholderia megapolitana]